MDNPKRFAAFVRVSTVKQSKQGESLEDQRTSIEEAVRALGGEVVEWYGGQEHATAGWEKKEIDRLLRDAKKAHPAFDAIMVAYIDRWSRDNEKSKEGLNTFRDAGIRFFVGQTESDLFNPEQKLILGMWAEIGSYQAEEQNIKSCRSRIVRAKRDRPSAGSLPFGRTYNKITEKWGVDPEKKRLIEEIAKRYLAGERLRELAREKGMDYPTLLKTLTKRCGTEWKVRFDVKKLNIHETVTLKMPRLLDEKTIEAIREKVSANKTYTHGQSKHTYLLNRVIFCGHCNRALTGQTNKGYKVYRHCGKHQAEGKFAKPCRSPIPQVSADWIENIILRELFEAFGNPKGIEKAIQAALPDQEKAKEALQQRQSVDAQLAKVTAGRQRVIGMVAKGDLSEVEASAQLASSQKARTELETKLSQLDAFLSNRPSIEQVRAGAKDARRMFLKAKVKKNAIRDHYNNAFNSMTWEEKKHLVQTVFSGKTPDGYRMGVYVFPVETKRRNKVFRYTIKGIIVNKAGSEPLGDDGQFTIGEGKVSKSAGRKPNLSSYFLPFILSGTTGRSA